MENLIIRKSEKEDADFIYNLERKVFSSYRTKESIIYSLSDENYFGFTAFSKNIPVAYISCKNIANEIDIDDIAVDEDCRNKGIGFALLSFMLRAAVENRCFCATLEVRESNVPAVNLYEKVGFEFIGRRKNYYTHPAEDALIYTKKL